LPLKDIFLCVNCAVIEIRNLLIYECPKYGEYSNRKVA
jgi:hypothetical protein